jgi:16S rRNA G527 N7-methylase RsmG
MNLTHLPSEAVDRLFIEPIAASRHAVTGAKVIDIGSGGGSPAIPFALASHAKSLTMVESRSRKSVFLREAARAAGLRAEVVNSRFQSLLEERSRMGSFDVLTIRAVKIEAALVSELFAFLALEGCLLHFHTETLDAGQLSDGLSVTGVKLTERATLNIVKRSAVPRGTSWNC